MAPSPAWAHNAAETSSLGIVTSNDVMAPSGAYDEAFNGYKVFLSSPRHADSGSRGECKSPGYQENVNGRWTNWNAANGNYWGTAYSPTFSSRNLHGRGYKVNVSRNDKDNGFLANRTASQNWGSNVHIVTHTNASNGCNSASSYLLTEWYQTNDYNLATHLGTALNGDVPGGWNSWSGSGLAELSTNASNGDAYIELQFHDNQSVQSWIYYNVPYVTYNYGIGVDNHLGYP